MWGDNQDIPGRRVGLRASERSPIRAHGRQRWDVDAAVTDLVHYRVPIIYEIEKHGPRWVSLWVRPGTSDEDVLHECLQDDVYHLRGLDLPWSPNDQGIARPRILDIGACTGIFAALCLAQFPQAELVAVEPEAQNVELLNLNTGRWRDRITIVHAAVGATAGEVSLMGGHGTGHTAVWEEGNEGQRVAQVTLDSLLTEPVALLKLDIEGAEFSAIGAASEQSMARVERVALEFHGPGTCEWMPEDGYERQYGDLMAKLAQTHAVSVFGRPALGGSLFAHRYDI